MTVGTRPPHRPFSYEDLAGMPDDGYQREIIGGSLIVTPAPTGGHQRLVLNLATILRAAETDDVMAMVAPYDWVLPDGGSVQPDLVAIRRSDFVLAGPLPASAVPLLVVEVLSPSNQAQDLVLKRDLYERLAVPAYWMVDPVAPSILALALVDGRYRVEADTSAAFRSDWPLSIEFQLSDLVL